MAEQPQETSGERVPHVFVNHESGKEYRIYGPEGSTTEEAAEVFFGLTPEQQETMLILDPAQDVSAMDRLFYEFWDTDNITTNVGYYLKGHAPWLTNKWYYDDEEGLQILDAEDQYGNMDAMTAQERTDHMQKVDKENLKKKYQGVEQKKAQMKEQGEWNVAGGVGMLGAAVFDPVAFVPVGGQAAKGYKATKGAVGLGEKVAQGAAAGAKVGAIWGGAYGASEQLADTGIPTTGEEALKGAGRVLGGVTAGAVGGAVLGGAAPAARAAISSKVKSTTRKLMESDVGTKQMGYKFWDEVWKQQIAGNSGYESMKIARKKFGLSIADVSKIKIALSDQADIFTTAGGGIRNAAADAVHKRGLGRVAMYTDPSVLTRTQKTINWLIKPLDSRAKAISPRIATMLTEMEKNNLMQAHNVHRDVVPYFKLHRKMSKGDRRKVGLHLYNSEFDEALKIIERYQGKAGREAFEQMISALKTLAAAMKKEGMDFDVIDNYFPRMVKDVQGLKNYLHSHAKEFGDYQDWIRKAEKRKKGKLTPAEEVKVMNRWLEYGDIGKHKVKKSVKSTKKRRVRKITDGMLQFYDDPITSIDLHIRDTISGINRAKFFGRYKDGKNLLVKDKYGIENINDSIGNLTKKLGLDKNPEITEELRQILLSRFGKGEVAGNRAMATMRQGVGGLTLGNPYSALRQFGDVAAVVWLEGPINTLRALPKAAWATLRGQLGLDGNHGMDADSFGYMLEMAQELDTGGVASNAIKKASNALYKFGGFKTVDRFGKNTLIHAALNKGRSWSKTQKGRAKFMEKYGDFYDGDEIMQLMNDLRDGKMTDLVKTHISAEVMKIQPISRSQLPQAYLDHPNGRALYQFRTWGLKQLDLIRTEIMTDVLSGDPVKMARGSANLGYYTVLMGASGLTITQIQRHLTGRVGAVEDWSDVPDEVILHTMANLGVDRYGLTKTIERVDPSYFAEGFYPPAFEIPAGILAQSAAVLKNTATDDWETRNKHAKELTRNFGGFGRMIHWLFLGGAEEFNEKEIDKRLQGAL
jgi:hypothetical protein